MGKFEGPFGVPTPERVFADYEEKQQKKMNNFNGGSTICINYNDNNDDIDDLYDYCDDLDDSIGDLYDSTKNQISKLQNQIYDIKIENEILKKENKKLNERIDNLSKILIPLLMVLKDRE